MRSGSQQLWPALVHELHAQLEGRRHARQAVGRLPALCWTDHANVARQSTAVHIDDRMLRWITEIESDGPQLRNLSGRAAVLGDVLGRRFEAELAQSARALRTFDVV
eukprot:15466474-Alexandrium_andersonii.AAC.1